MRTPILSAIIGLLLILLPAIAFGQSLEYVNSTLWTGNLGVRTVGNYAFCNFVNGLVTVDISNEEMPVVLNRYYTYGGVFDFEISGNYAYIVAGVEGLKVLDISNPNNISCLSGLDLDSLANGIELLGNYAYVSDYYVGLKIIDISNLNNPILVATYPLPDFIRDFKISGSRLYISSYSGMKILNLVDPISPTLESNLTSVAGHSICISDNYVYVVDSYEGVQIVDVHDPANPVKVGKYDNGSSYYKIYVEGIFAYVANGSIGVQILDITDKANPALETIIDSDFGSYNVFASDNKLYETDISGELQIYDVSNISQPQLLGQTSGNDFSVSIAVYGNYAYSAKDYSGMDIYNITDPLAPYIIGSYNSERPLIKKVFEGNYMYAMPDYNSGFSAINISDPSNPTREGGIDIHTASKFTVAENYAYLLVDFTGLCIVDFSYQSQPVMTSELYLDTYFESGGIIIKDGYAYIGDFHNGLLVVDISDPYNPGLISQIWSIIAPEKIVLYENYLFVIAYDRLIIVDISNRIQPSPENILEYDNRIVDFKIFENYGILAFDTGGILVLDLANPVEPLEVTRYNTPGIIKEIAIAGDYIFVADTYSLITLRLDRTHVNEVLPQPANYSLSQNYPNPFNAQTTISYSLPEAGPVNIAIYNIIGQKMAVIENGIETAGEHRAVWDATGVPSGLYFARLETAGQSRNIKMTVVK